MTTRDHFSIKGHIAGEEVTIAWNDLDGFNDPTGRTAMLVIAGDEVALTPTGPFYRAAERPAEVAIVTAISAFPSDAVYEVDEAGVDLLVAIHEENDVPPGAVA